MTNGTYKVLEVDRPTVNERIYPRKIVETMIESVREKMNKRELRGKQYDSEHYTWPDFFQMMVDGSQRGGRVSMSEKTVRLKKELVVPGYWHYFVNHYGDNDAVWIPPCKYPADTEFEVIKEGIACGPEKEVRGPHIPDGTHIAVCRWEQYPVTEDQIGVAEMFVVPVTMLEGKS